MFDEHSSPANDPSRLEERAPLRVPFCRPLYQAFPATGQSAVAAIPLSGDDEKPSVAETLELVAQLEKHVIRANPIETAYECERRMNSGELLEIRDDLAKLTCLDRVDFKDLALVRSLIDTLINVASFWVASRSTRLAGFFPGCLFLRENRQVVYLPGISNARRWPAAVRPYLPSGSGSDRPGQNPGDKERALCSNIVCLMFALVHGELLDNIDLNRVRDRRLRKAWRTLLETRSLSDLKAQLQAAFLMSSLRDAGLNPVPVRGRTRRVAAALLILAALVGGAAFVWRWDDISKMGSSHWATLQKKLRGMRGGESQPNLPGWEDSGTESAKPIPCQKFVLLAAPAESTDGPSTSSFPADPSAANSQAVFKPAPTEVENVRRVVAQSAHVDLAAVTFDPQSGQWEIRNSSVYLQDILTALSQKIIALESSEDGRDLHFASPAAETTGRLLVRSLGGKVGAQGQLQLAFEVQNPPGEPNRYRTLTFQHETETPQVLDLTKNGSRVVFEPYFSRQYELKAERVEGGTDVYLGVVLCTQDEPGMRAALRDLFQRAETRVDDSQLSAFYQQNEPSTRFFLIKPEPLLRFLRNHFAQPDNQGRGKTAYRFIANR